MHALLHHILGVSFDVDQLNKFCFEHFQPSTVLWIFLEFQIFHHPYTLIVILQPHRIFCYFEETQTHIVKCAGNLDMLATIERSIYG